jgi:hypothetical protein
MRCNCARGEALTAADRIRDCINRGLQSSSQWLKQVDDWPISGLLVRHKTEIGVELLKADAQYRELDAVTPYRGFGSMFDAASKALYAAFDGVAAVLLTANILTRDILEDKLPSLIWNAGETGLWTEWGSFKEAYARSFQGCHFEVVG